MAIDNELKEAIVHWSLQWTSNKAMAVLLNVEKVAEDETLCYLFTRWHKMRSAYEEKRKRTAENVVRGWYESEDVEFTASLFDDKLNGEEIFRLNETIIDVLRDVHGLWS